MATLERAIELAVTHHRGQRDKAGLPYILHPLRVMLACQGEEAQMVAVMHDLLEDTPLTQEDLRREGFSAAVIEGVLSVTRQEQESYEEFVLRAKAHPLGRAVKLADLEDNMDVRRLAALTDKDLTRLQRYRESWQLLLKT
jgi:(p)ppGpp synthase/HD superfamily hydrolase